MPPFVPEAADVIWLQFNPRRGREQTGHRPALCISPGAYNKATGLMVCCPMTTRVKRYPFEVQIADRKGGVVLADQIKSLDWRAREARLSHRVSVDELAEVQAKIRALLFSE